MRKLATIERIVDIQPIDGADAIEVVTVRNWKVVVAKKDNYKVGDLVYYIEIDSFVPTELAPFLSKGKEPSEYNGVKGERLRTVRLRGQVSQGLVLPLHIKDGLASYLIRTYSAGPGSNFEDFIGVDVSEFFGIEKYEPPIPAQLSGIVKGAWPSAVVKTDEERIQNFSGKDWYEFKQSGSIVEVTEKLEGSSCQFGLIDGEFVVLSRNLNLAETESNSMWQQVRRYDVERKMRELNLDGFMFQSEIVGEGIQGNHYGIKGQDIYVFAIYNTNTGKFLAPGLRAGLCASIGLKHVPITFESLDIHDMKQADVLAMADGMSIINPNKLREGLVFKQVNGQGHFKAVSDKYLEKTGN